MTTFDEAKATAQQMWERRHEHLYFNRATAYCHEHGLEREDQLLSVMHKMAHDAYMERAKPYIELKVKYANLSLTFPAEIESSIDEILKMIAKSCGLEIHP